VCALDLTGSGQRGPAVDSSAPDGVTSVCLVLSLLSPQCQLCLHDVADPHPHGACGPQVVQDRDPEAGVQLHIAPRHPAARRYEG